MPVFGRMISPSSVSPVPRRGWRSATSSCTGWSITRSDAMDTILNAMTSDGGGLFVSLFVFAAAALAAFGIMAAVQLRGAVKRRAAGIVLDSDDEPDARTLARSGVKAAQRLIDYTTKHYATLDDRNMKHLRSRLVQAGIFDSRAVGFFFLARAVMAVALAAVVFILLPIFVPNAEGSVWM